MAEISANVSDFDRTADNITTLIDEIQTHMKTIGQSIDAVRNEWTDEEGAKFASEYADVTKSLENVITDVEGMVYIMRVASKAYSEAKGLVSKSVNGSVNA